MTAAEKVNDKLRPYSAYKPCTLENVPQIPTTWDIVPLHRLASVKARLGWKALKADEYTADGYIFLATPNIKGRDIDFTNVNYIDQFRYLESPEIMVQEDDVLLAKDGSTLGTVNVVRHLPRPSTVNSSIAVLRTDKAAMKGAFLYYYLSSALMQGAIGKVKDGMGVPHLFQSDIRKFAVIAPPTAEQTAITAFLDRETARIDELLREQKALLDDLGLKRLVSIRTAVTTGLDPKTTLLPTSHPWIDKLPQHWVPRKISRSFPKIGSGTTPPAEQAKYYGGEIKWVNTGDLTDGPVTEVPKTVTAEAMRDFSSLRVYPEGTLLMAMYGATIGKLGLLEAEACTNQACCAFVGGGQLDTKFAFYWLMAMRENIVALGYGGGQPNISQQTIRNMVIPAPAVIEQQAIIDHLDAQLAQIDELTEEVRASMTLMRQHRAALITAAVTGKIDVRQA